LERQGGDSDLEHSGLRFDVYFSVRKPANTLNDRRTRLPIPKTSPVKTAALILVAIAIFSALLLARPRTSAAQSPESPDVPSLERQIVAKEREGMEALKTGDLKRFGDLTADDAVLVDAQGPATKAQVLKNVTGFTLTDYSMDDVKFVPLADKSGLITYKISEKGVSHGKEFAAQAYVSSIWTKRGSDWVCLFSQETAARQH
jgi:ketosteroid isomerase-like protein